MASNLPKNNVKAVSLAWTHRKMQTSSLKIGVQCKPPACGRRFTLDPNFSGLGPHFLLHPRQTHGIPPVVYLWWSWVRFLTQSKECSFQCRFVALHLKYNYPYYAKIHGISGTPWKYTRRSCSMIYYKNVCSVTKQGYHAKKVLTAISWTFLYTNSSVKN